MNQIKIGEFIKKLRIENNLTQKDLADKYGVTYQAVSKWERGINIPDIAILKQISKDFNIDINYLLDGNKDKKIPKYFIALGISFILIIILLLIIFFSKEKFVFKTISTSCNNFTISGSISYNKNKSSIYITNIKYCGVSDTTKYDSISSTLYETHEDITTKISDHEIINNITLDNYLQKLEFIIDNYETNCKDFSNNNLYIEILATKDEKITNYKIPLSLTSCRNST